MTVDEAELPVSLWAQRLPSDVLELHTGMIERLQEDRLVVEPEWLTCDDLFRATEGEHEGVVTSIAPYIEDPHARKALGHFLAQADPSLIAAPRSTDDQIPTDV